MPESTLMEQQTQWLIPEPPTAAPEPAPSGAVDTADELVPRHYAPGGRISRKESFIKRRLAPLGAALAALLTKLKALLLLLPKLKLLISAGTMLISIAAYSLVFGWTFAMGFVALLLVHELGHVIQLRREGLKASLPMFIPFLGAVISARSLGDNALAEARVGLAGPILGSLGSVACVALWHLTGNDIWRALAFTGFFLNLFNLLPVVPLDGGRAMAAMTPWMWFVGFAALIPMAVFFPNPIVFLIVLIGGFETYKRWKLRRAGGEVQRAYYRVRPLNRALVAAVYLSLAAALIVGLHLTTLPRTFG